MNLACLQQKRRQFSAAQQPGHIDSRRLSNQRVKHGLKALAAESQQSISGVLTEAIAEYVQRRRVRSEVRSALEKSIDKNRKLGELLAK